MCESRTFWPVTHAGVRLLTHAFPALRLHSSSTGASRVVIFDHKVRYGDTNWHGLGKDNASKRGPLLRVHVDQSPKEAQEVLKRRLPEEAAELRKKRFQIINVSASRP